jgi:3-oxoadipate enol-lactonase
VLALLDSLDLPRVSYCGLSLGGMVGIWLATQAPDRVDRLALCCTSAYLPPAQGWRDRASRVRAGGMVAIADTVLPRWFSPGWREDNPQAWERARAMLVGTPPDGYAACCEAIAAHDLRAALPSISARTLVVSGGNDVAIPPEHGAAIALAVPGARFAILPEAAHLPAIEMPDGLAAALLAHFTQEVADG